MGVGFNWKPKGTLLGLCCFVLKKGKLRFVCMLGDQKKGPLFSFGSFEEHMCLKKKNDEKMRKQMRRRKQKRKARQMSTLGPFSGRLHAGHRLRLRARGDSPALHRHREGGEVQIQHRDLKKTCCWVAPRLFNRNPPKENLKEFEAFSRHPGKPQGVLRLLHLTQNVQGGTTRNVEAGGRFGFA